MSTSASSRPELPARSSAGRSPVTNSRDSRAGSFTWSLRAPSRQRPRSTWRLSQWCPRASGAGGNAAVVACAAEWPLVISWPRLPWLVLGAAVASADVRAGRRARWVWPLLTLLLPRALRAIRACGGAHRGAIKVLACRGGRGATAGLTCRFPVPRLRRGQPATRLRTCEKARFSHGHPQCAARFPPFGPARS